MRELIIQTLRESVKRYPELKTYLTDETLMLYWISEFKVGEAPDDELRREDERKLERALAKFLEGQKARVLTYMRTHDMKAIQPSFWDDELERLWAELGEDFVGVLLHGVEGGISLLPGSGTGLPIDEDKINMSLVKWGREYKDTWLSKIEETSRQYVEDKITAWSLSGQPLSELIKTMDKDTGGMFTKTRATRIAVTETTRLHALGNQKAWEEAGTVSQWRWNTANDELVCPICRPNNGKLFPLSELHSKLPAHVNCRCWSSPVWDEEAELERILGEGGVGGTSLEITNEIFDDLEGKYERMNIDPGNKISGLYSDYMNSLSEDQKNAISAYTGGQYGAINGYLRNGNIEISQDILQNWINNINDALSNAPEMQDTKLVYRSIYVERKNLNKIGIDKGAIWEDKGFFSTSLSSDPGKQFKYNNVWFEVVVPKGAKNVGYINSISQNSGEDEMLFSSGSKFKVVDTYTGKLPGWGVDNTIVRLVYLGSGD